MSRWDETPGPTKMGAETPGATPGQSTRMWDATPGHTTPATGAATPGRDTPGHIGATQTSVRRNRWDETPKTERGNIFVLQREEICFIICLLCFSYTWT